MTPDPSAPPSSSTAAAAPQAPPADAAHVPAPVDLETQSVAGEEDPGASLDMEDVPQESGAGTPSAAPSSSPWAADRKG